MGADERYRHDYYTRALLRLPERGVPLAGVDVCGQPWLEVDTPADLAAARAADHYLS
jgi:choline kinase